jgi:hypothetical protein
MTNEEYEAGEIIRKGAASAIQGVKKSLEVITNNLDNDLPMLGASNLPEYIKAKEAIDTYNLAVSNKINLLKNNSK